MTAPNGARWRGGSAPADHAGASDPSAVATAPRASKPLTVLQVVPALNSGGVERGALEITEAIAAAGGRALIASEGGRMERLVPRLGGELIRLPLATKNPVKLRRNARALADVIRSEGVDIVHARSRAPAWSALWAARAANAAFITTYHGVYSANWPLKRRYNRVMALGAPVIAISEYVAEHVRAQHRVPNDRLVVIPRGADLKVFSIDATAPGRVVTLAQDWGVSDDPRPVILMPGRLTRWKGQMLFVEAMARIIERRGPESALGVIVGGDDKDGRFGAELAARIEELDLGDCVKLVGHCDDMAAAYRLASYAVSASLEPEAFGRVAVEAQAMGVPVIAAAHGGACETVEDGATGWWFAPGDPAALSQAIAYALDLQEISRAAMADRAIARVRERYSVDAMQRATLSVYERVAGRSFGA